MGVDGFMHIFGAITCERRRARPSMFVAKKIDKTKKRKKKTKTKNKTKQKKQKTVLLLRYR
jgi:hypothetical protein